MWQLVSSLHGENKDAAQGPVLTEKLWQARLVLKLAEILAEEQAEINKGVTDLNRAEQAVFNAIKGELDDRNDWDEVFPASGLGMGGGQDAGKIKHLLKAWGALFAMDSKKHSLLVTDSEDGAAILFDAWEELSAERPQLLVEFDLPVAESIEAMEAVRAELAEAGTDVSRSLQGIMAGGGGAGCGRAGPRGRGNRRGPPRCRGQDRTGGRDRVSAATRYPSQGEALSDGHQRLSGFDHAGDDARIRRCLLVGVQLA